LHDLKRGGPAENDKTKLTGVGYVLTMLSVAVILGVALPVVRWRDPATGQQLPREVALFAPFLIGAAVQGIGSLFLRLIGLRVWAKPGSDVER
jgi:hypothetical protein